MTAPVCKTFTYNNYAEASAQDEAQKLSSPQPESVSMWEKYFGNNEPKSVDPAKRIEVKLTYCDTTEKAYLNSYCNRKIVTEIEQNFYPIESIDYVYHEGNPFQEESRKYPDSFLGSFSRGEGSSFSMSGGRYTRKQWYNTGCFDWDEVLDGNKHIRGLAAYELPGLEPKPYEASQDASKCILDKLEGEERFVAPVQNDIISQETAESLNNVALATFAVLTASVIGYGIYSLYKRCTQPAA